jgi:hypothetical protein
MLGIIVDSYDAVVWATSHFFGPLNSQWFNRKQQVSILDTFDSLVSEICKTSMLPKIRDDAINGMLGLTSSFFSYASYTQLFNEYLRRSRESLTDYLHCIRFINNGLANFQLQTQAKSHRFQQTGCNMPHVESQND